jgi:hypothetical protein
LPGNDQYVEYIADSPGFVLDGSISTSALWKQLTASSGCDIIHGCAGVAPNTQWTEYLSITGPQASTDPSSSFSTSVTWTAS